MCDTDAQMINAYTAKNYWKAIFQDLIHLDIQRKY